MTQKKYFSDLYVIVFKYMKSSLVEDDTCFESKEIAEKVLSEFERKEDFVVISLSDYMYEVRKEQYNEGFDSGYDSAQTD